MNKQEKDSSFWHHSMYNLFQDTEQQIFQYHSFWLHQCCQLQLYQQSRMLSHNMKAFALHFFFIQVCIFWYDVWYNLHSDLTLSQASSDDKHLATHYLNIRYLECQIRNTSQCICFITLQWVYALQMKVTNGTSFVQNVFNSFTSWRFFYISKSCCLWKKILKIFFQVFMLFNHSNKNFLKCDHLVVECFIAYSEIMFGTSPIDL